MSERNYTIQQIAGILHINLQNAKSMTIINNLVIDSRSIVDPEGALFFAIPAQRNGHEFIREAYETGVRNFVISDLDYTDGYDDANFLLVPDVLKALQAIAAYNRSQFNNEVIAITGSNGKTVVKEWLYQLLAADFNIVRSPKSFNSQIGVP
ncbi:MAG: Mur ligase domain-containing protein, partial [Pedobacter sp.]|nr:Mur ligase domain-containing protein [Pedobacter sp.]